MKIIPFEKVGQFNFKDNYDKIKESIVGNYKEDILEEIDKKYPRIYLEEFDFMINFNNINMISETYSVIQTKIRQVDSNLNVEPDSFESEQFGITVTRELDDSGYSDKIESILISSKEYLSEDEFDLDDLYKSIAGEDYPE